jgi:uncharacterized protein (TIGR03086 family)
MTEISDRFRAVAAAFTDRVQAVPAGGWDRPSPCPDWTAKDVVFHLAQAGGMFLGRVGVELPEAATQTADPVAAWTATRDTLQAALDDPSIAGREYEGPMGTSTLEKTIGMFGVGDVLVHTWDLARAVGLDEHLDEDEVQRLLAVMEPNDEMMRKGTAFGPKVPVPDDADAQTKLLAFTGRRP